MRGDKKRISLILAVISNLDGNSVDPICKSAVSPLRVAENRDGLRDRGNFGFAFYVSTNFILRAFP